MRLNSSSGLFYICQSIITLLLLFEPAMKYNNDANGHDEQ